LALLLLLLLLIWFDWWSGQWRKGSWAVGW